MKTCLIAFVVLLTSLVAEASSPSSPAPARVEQTAVAETPPTNSADPAAAEESEESSQIVQEVFQSELVYPQEKGEVQVTSGAVWNEEDEGHSMRIPVVLEYGFTDAWQIGMELNPVQNLKDDDGGSASGMGDLELGTKYSFMNIGGSPFHAALGVDVTLPLGDPDEGLGEGLVEVEPYLAVGRDFPEWSNVHLFGQVGLGLVRRTRGEDDEPAAHELSVNSGLVIPVQNVRFVAELNWSTNRWNNEGDEASLFITPGVVWDLPGTWEAGIGAPIGLMDEGDRFRVIAQLTWEFGGD